MPPEIVIRKSTVCGHWSIFVLIVIDSSAFYYKRELHLESFSDVLLWLNGETTDVYA